MTDKPPPTTKKPAVKRSWAKGQKRNPSAKSKSRKAAEAAVYERARAKGIFV